MWFEPCEIARALTWSRVILELGVSPPGQETAVQHLLDT